MANRGQAQYFRLFDDSGTYYRWQNYYVNQTVTWDTASWNYQPFIVNGLIGGSPGSDVGLTIDAPATALVVGAFETALANAYLCEIELYEFDASLSNSTPQAGQLLIGAFVGESITLKGSFSLLTLGLGSSLSPTGAQAPPRKYTNILVGAPLRM